MFFAVLLVLLFVVFATILGLMWRFFLKDEERQLEAERKKELPE